MLPQTIDYDADITCIDTEQVRPGLAAAYLIRGGDQYAFIECGTSLSVPGLLAVLEARGIAREQLAYVMPTHVHLDHASGAGLLMRELPAARLVVHPRGARHLIDPSKLIEGASAVYGAENLPKLYGEILPVPEARVLVAEDNYELDLGGRPLRFIDAPGHARHHYAIWDATSRGWFTGDTFGISYRETDDAAGPYLFPTTTPVQFEPDAWRNTLDRFLAVGPEAAFLTHYGRVGNFVKLAEDLRRGLDHYERIGLSLIDAPNRHEQLKVALLQLALEELRARGNTLTATEAGALLAMDIELNAQGLGVWLDKRKTARS